MLMTIIIHMCFLKEYQYIEEKVVRHIHDNLNGFSSDDDGFDESDEE